MKFLLMSDDVVFSSKILKIVKELDETATVYTTDFQEENLLKVKEHLNTISLCIIYSDPGKYKQLEETTFISSVVGYLFANNTAVITNSRHIAYHTLYTSDGVKFLQTDEKIISHIKKQYKKIAENDEIRLAKNELYRKGIPFTPDCLAIYIEKNKPEIIDLFLKAKIDSNSTDDLGTPLLNIAVRNENLELTEQLLQSGANLNAISEDRGYTAVMDAVWKGNFEITKYLIDKGADLNTINKEGQNNLVLAVGANKTEIVKLLAENGADPDIKDQMGMSAYGYATLFKKDDIVEILKPFHKE